MNVEEFLEQKVIKRKFSKPCQYCNGTGQEIDQAKWGAEMRRLRKEKGISGRQMAKLLHISAPYLSDLELGRRHWSTDLSSQVIFHCRK